MKTVQEHAEYFAAWLKTKMDERQLRFAADLVRISGLSNSAISNLLSPKESPNTGKYSLPRRESVLALARALGVDKEEALQAAGYAPQLEVGREKETFFVFALRQGVPTPITEITDEALIASLRKAIADYLAA